MTLKQVRRQISDLSPQEIRRLGREMLAVDRYRPGELDLSGFALEAGISSLLEAANVLREFGIEPRPNDLMTLEGMLAALQSGGLDFVAGDEDLYSEADLRERY